MALSEEEKAFMKAQLAHDELSAKENRSKKEEEELAELEVQLFEARKNHRTVVAAKLQTMEGSADQPAKRGN